MFVCCLCVVGITDRSLLRGWVMFVCCRHHRRVIVERLGDVCLL